MADKKFSQLATTGSAGLTDTIATTTADGTPSVKRTLSQIADALSPGWTTPSFSAGDYTAGGGGGGSWTVASGDVATFAYQIEGKRMTVAFVINATTVGVTTNELRIAIPGGKTSTKGVINTCYIRDNTVDQIGYCSVDASGTLISIFKADASNYLAATDATRVRGQITFEIN